MCAITDKYSKYVCTHRQTKQASLLPTRGALYSADLPAHRRRLLKTAVETKLLNFPPFPFVPYPPSFLSTSVLPFFPILPPFYPFPPFSPYSPPSPGPHLLNPADGGYGERCKLSSGSGQSPAAK